MTKICLKKRNIAQRKCLSKLYWKKLEKRKENSVKKRKIGKNKKQKKIGKNEMPANDLKSNKMNRKWIFSKYEKMSDKFNQKN